MKLSIVIPAYNEEENIGPLMDGLLDLRKKQRWDCEIVVVDDNSSDRTGKIADSYRKQKKVVVIHRKKGNNGMGFSGSRGNLEFSKALMSSGYSFLSRIIFGIPAHDITNAFRAFRKEMFNKIKIDAGDFAISPEFSLKAHLNGYSICEVPTTYHNRESGKSNFNVLKMGRRYVSLFGYKFVKN
jgi:GT2 family glycosyltransferase